MSKPSDSASTEIDPHFLHGYPKLAAELFPDDGRLAGLQAQLVGTHADLQEELARTDATMAEWVSVDAAVRETRDHDERLDLAYKRVALAGLLAHAPNDVANAAYVWAYTLLDWAKYIRPRAWNFAEEAAKLARPIEAARHQALHNLEPGGPSISSPSPELRGGYQEKAKELLEKLQPHAALRDSALALERGAVGELTSRFGDLDNRGAELEVRPPGANEQFDLRGAELPLGQVRDWIEEMRNRTAEKTRRANPLVTDALRPKGTMV